MTDAFTVSVVVRGYETDSQGHLNSAVYMQYAEHARWSGLEAAGIRQSALLEQGVGLIVLETNIKYLKELRAGDEVAVSCRYVFGTGRTPKTFRFEQEIVTADGTLAAEVSSAGGLLDLKERRLVPDPRVYFRALASDPGVLGL
ncbi:MULTISPECIES: acyl-CoA thioesterase [Streptomyces]|uniref:Acyl-CoA thioesterase n=1 Tax=Streptomyces morookaense TaxID=1970 RepID=A0A7Y7B2Z3_STRMO|nr:MULTISPECIES: acyl-CoA thioesterase [Streptomyces]MCC2279463.1 acyl-CoA thioesterase [Streptomyces sp. ET3-23]NVK78037.1 acyl-CoA thioesterase [Streptomyces morookaense]GHF16218.1 thioesterase [Streptomyces morookaense]